MLKGIKWTGVAFAVVTAIGAFISEIGNQNQLKKISDMERRITDLEQKGAE